MGKYIGQDISYGLFEKQLIQVANPPATEYDLYHVVPSATSIQVVCERAVLEPYVDYTVLTENGKSTLKIHNIDLTNTGDDSRLSLYVIYLGQKLLIPANTTDDARITNIENNYAQTSYVNTKIDNLVNSAPAVLDTLKELSDALGADPNFATTITNKIAESNLDISNLETRVDNLESDVTLLQSNLTTEIANREQAVLTLDTRVDALESGLTSEETRALAAEADLDTRVDALENASPPVSSLDDLSNVTITSPTNGQVLKYNGSDWINSSDATFSGDYNDLTNKPTIPQAIDDLSDVSVSSATKGQLIAHNGTSFVNTRTLEADDALTVPLIVKGAASQTANYFQIQDSSASNLVTVQPNDNTFTPLVSINSGVTKHGLLIGSGNTSALSADTYSTNIRMNGGGVAHGDIIYCPRATSNGYGHFRFLTTGGVISSTIPSASIGVKAIGVYISNPGEKGVFVKGDAAQTANLIEAQNSSGAVLFSIDKDGSIAAGSVPVARVSGLSTVATSGSYNDLVDQPTIPNPTNPEFKTIKLTNNLDSPKFCSIEENVVLDTQDDSIQEMYRIAIDQNSLYTFDITISAKFHNTSAPALAKGISGKLKFFVIRPLDSLTMIADGLNGSYGGLIKEIEMIGNPDPSYDFNVQIENNIDPNTLAVISSYVKLSIKGEPSEFVWWGANIKYTKLVS